MYYAVEGDCWNPTLIECKKMRKNFDILLVRFCMSRAKVNRKHSKTIIVIHRHLFRAYVGGWAWKTVYWRSFESHECMDWANLHIVTVKVSLNGWQLTLHYRQFTKKCVTIELVIFVVWKHVLSYLFIL